MRAASALLALLAACGPAAPRTTSPTAAPEQAMNAISQRVLARYLELNPTDATDLGEHRFDGRWPPLGADRDKQVGEFIAATSAELAALDEARLSPADRVDRAIIQGRLDYWRYQLERRRPWVNDPLSYTSLIGDGLDPLVTREFAPHAERMESLRQRLETLPAVVAAARATLGRPPRIATETAVAQVKGLIGLVEGLGPEFAKEPARKADLEAAAAKAVAALRDLEAFYAGELLARSDGDFRRGREAYVEELRLSLGADLPADELYATARATLERTQEEMVATALELWPELFPREAPPRPGTHAEKMQLVKKVLDAVAADRPSNDTVLDDIRKIAAQATEFVRAHDLVRLPDEPLRVIAVPEYKRGVAVGYCESSGPLERNRQASVAISPAPADWPPQRVESFYREYNRAMLADFVVHEAMPGHYLQVAHANRSSDLVRSVFSSGPFVEGWAVYGEWLMARHGFGGARVRLQRQKMMLRSAANAILDHDVHAGTMTREEALALIMGQALQEEGEAVGKWRRAQLTCGQLSTYFYGYLEMMRVRERAEKLPGFNERAFHDKLLSFGSPPPRFLGHLMFGDDLVVP